MKEEGGGEEEEEEEEEGVRICKDFSFRIRCKFVFSSGEMSNLSR